MQNYVQIKIIPEKFQFLVGFEDEEENMNRGNDIANDFNLFFTAALMERLRAK